MLERFKLTNEQCYGTEVDVAVKSGIWIFGSAIIGSGDLSDDDCARIALTLKDGEELAVITEKRAKAILPHRLQDNFILRECSHVIRRGEVLEVKSGVEEKTRMHNLSLGVIQYRIPRGYLGV
jgi:hypothetical protein